MFQLLSINLLNCLQEFTPTRMCRRQSYPTTIGDWLLCLGGLGRIDSTCWLLLPGIQKKSKGLAKGWDGMQTLWIGCHVETIFAEYVAHQNIEMSIANSLAHFSKQELVEMGNAKFDSRDPKPLDGQWPLASKHSCVPFLSCHASSMVFHGVSSGDCS